MNNVVLDLIGIVVFAGLRVYEAVTPTGFSVGLVFGFLLGKGFYR